MHCVRACVRACMRAHVCVCVYIYLAEIIVSHLSAVYATMSAMTKANLTLCVDFTVIV